MSHGKLKLSHQILSVFLFCFLFACLFLSLVVHFKDGKKKKKQKWHSEEADQILKTLRTTRHGLRKDQEETVIILSFQIVLLEVFWSVLVSSRFVFSATRNTQAGYSNLGEAFGEWARGYLWWEIPTNSPIRCADSLGKKPLVCPSLNHSLISIQLCLLLQLFPVPNLIQHLGFIVSKQ